MGSFLSLSEFVCFFCKEVRHLVASCTNPHFGGDPKLIYREWIDFSSGLQSQNALYDRHGGSLHALYNRHGGSPNALYNRHGGSPNTLYDRHGGSPNALYDRQWISARSIQKSWRILEHII